MDLMADFIHIPKFKHTKVIQTMDPSREPKIHMEDRLTNWIPNIAHYTKARLTLLKWFNPNEALQSADELEASEAKCWKIHNVLVDKKNNRFKNFFFHNANNW